MTVRIPIWIVVVVGVVVIAVGAFLIGRLTEDAFDSPPSASAPSEEVDDPPLPCNKQTGLDAIATPKTDAFLRAWFPVPPRAKVNEFFRVERVYCEDLTGDDITEMIVQLVAGASGGATPWVIFEQTAGEWRNAFLREGPGNERVMRVAKDGIRTSMPVYAVGDPLCCPTGERHGMVRYEDGDYSFTSEAGTDNRQIAVDREGSTTLGGLKLASADPAAATAMFGVATSTVREDVTCKMEWADIGLTLNFANFGGDNPCTGEGAIGSALVQGPAAELAGWRTGEGLTVGDSLGNMLEIYPDARTSQRLNPDPTFGVVGRGFVLKTKETPIGQGTESPSLIGRVQDGAVVGIELPVGAAGD